MLFEVEKLQVNTSPPQKKHLNQNTPPTTSYKWAYNLYKWH